jgi:hypothetical protein
MSGRYTIYTVSDAHCKKKLAVFLSPAGMSLTILWRGIIKLFPARESLVSDIPAVDGKIGNLFYSVRTVILYLLMKEAVYTFTAAKQFPWV